MSIESLLEKLTLEISNLTAAIERSTKSKSIEIKRTTEVVKPMEAVKEVVQEQTRPVSNPAPQEQQIASTPQAEMPAPPSFLKEAQPQEQQIAPASQPAAIKAPFTDNKGMVAYVVNAFKELGKEKANDLQNVLSGLGYSNVNHVKPEHYDELYNGIESLK